MAERIGAGLETNFDPENTRSTDTSYPLSEPLVQGGLDFYSLPSTFTAGTGDVTLDVDLGFNGLGLIQNYGTVAVILNRTLDFDSLDQSENYDAPQYSVALPILANSFNQLQSFGTNEVTLDYTLNFDPHSESQDFDSASYVLLSYLNFNSHNQLQSFGINEVSSDVNLSFTAFDQSEDYETGVATLDWSLGFSSLINTQSYPTDGQFSVDWDIPFTEHIETQDFNTGQFSLAYSVPFNSVVNTLDFGQALIERVYSAATITSPATNLTGNSLTVEWVPANPPQIHKLTVSSVEQGVLFQDNNILGTTTQVALEGLPFNGEALTFTLEFKEEDGTTPAFDVVTFSAVQAVLSKNSEGTYLVGSEEKFSWSGVTSLPDTLTLFGVVIPSNSSSYRLPPSTFPVGDAGSSEVILSATYGTNTYTISETYNHAKDWILNLDGNTCLGTGLSLVWDTDTPHADTFQITSDNGIDTTALAYTDPGSSHYSKHLLGIPTDGLTSTFTLTGNYSGESFVLDTGTITHTTTGNLPSFVLPTVAIRDDDEVFTISNQGNPTTNRVEIHTTPTLGSLIASDSEPAGTTLTVNNIPDTPSTVYAFLFSTYPANQEYSVNRSYTNERPNYLLLSPDNTNPLIGSNWEFTFSSDIAPVTWQVIVDGYSDSGTFSGTETSYLFTDFPDDGLTYTVRLRGVDEYGDARDVTKVYQTYDVNAVPRITTPVAGASLTDTTQNFIWDENSTNVTEFELDVGTTYGGIDYYDGVPVSLPTNSQIISGFPIDGSPIYARLSFTLFGTPQEANYIYYAQYIVPHLTDNFTYHSLNVVKLPNPNHTFYWGPYGEPNLTNYRLTVESKGTNTHPDGTLIADGNILYDSGELPSSTTQLLVNTLPIYDYLVTVTLHWKVDGVWNTTTFFDFYQKSIRLYGAKPYITTPYQTVTDSSFNVEWVPDYVPVTSWAIEAYQGVSISGIPFYSESELSEQTLSTTIQNIPTDGGNFTLKLAYSTSEGWSDYIVKQYATLSTPRITSPTSYYSMSPTRLFQWSPEGSVVTEWRITLGTTPGGVDVYDSGALPSNTLSDNISGIPTPGVLIYATLYYVVGGQTLSKSYTYNSYVAPPQIISPGTNANVSPQSLSISWTNGGNVVTDWRLLLGSSSGGSDLHDTGVIASNIYSETIQNLPEYLTYVYPTLLWSFNNGLTWNSASSYYRLQIQPTVTVSRSGYYESTITVSWAPNEVTVTNYALDITYTDNNEVVTSQATIAPNVLSYTFVAPANGRYFNIDLDYTQNDSSAGLITRTISSSSRLVPYDFPDVVSPGTSSSSPTQLLNVKQNVIWNLGNIETILTSLYIQIIRQADSAVLYDSGSLPIPTVDHTVRVYPHGQENIYIRLNYDTSEHSPAYKDYPYISPLAPIISSPVEGSTLNWDDTTFIWDSDKINVSAFELILTDHVDGHQVGFDTQLAQTYYSSGEIQGNVRVVPFIPQGITTLYAFLVYEAGEERFYTFKTYTTNPLGYIAPTPDDQTNAPNGDFTVKWIPSGLGEQYQVKVKLNDNPSIVIFDSGVIGSTEVTIPESLTRDGNTWLIELTYIDRSSTVFPLILYTVAADIEFFPLAFTTWDNFTEVIKYSNYVNTYRDGTEHRYTASPSFEHKLTATVPTTKGGLPILLQTIQKLGEAKTIVPLWNHAVNCATKLSDTVHQIPIEEGVLHKRFAPGQAILLWNNERDYRPSTVVFRTSSTLTVLGAGANYSQIVPLVNGYVSYSRGGNIAYEGNYPLAISVDIIQDKKDYEIASEIQGHNPSWFIGDTVHYLPGNSQLSFNQLKYNITSKSFTTPVITGRKAQLTLSYSIAMTTAKQIADFTYLLTKLRGIEGDFIQPIYSEIFEIEAITSTYVDVKTYNKFRPLDYSVVTHVIFIGKESKAILNITDLGTGYRIYFESPMLELVPSCDVLFGVRCRMSKSDTSIVWYDSHTAEASISVIEVLPEE